MATYLGEKLHTNVQLPAILPGARGAALLWQGAAAATGLVLGAGQVYGGAAPFGLAFTMVCPPLYLFAAAGGVLISSLAFQPAVLGVKVIAALTATVAVRRLLQDKPNTKNAGIWAGCLALALVQAAVLFFAGGYVDLSQAAATGTTALLAAGSAWLMRRFPYREPRGLCLWLAIAAACLQRCARGPLAPGLAVAAAAGLCAAFAGTLEETAVVSITLAAAITAANEGKSVVLMDKMGVFGGDTALSGGEMAVPGNWIQVTQGIEDSPENLVSDMLVGGDNKGDPELVAIIANGALDSANWLTYEGGVSWKHDLMQFGGHNIKRSIIPITHSGSEMTTKLTNRVNGMDDIVLIDNTKAVELVTDDAGAVTGVKVENPVTGDTSEVKCKAVVLATGGFGSNVDMRVKYNPEMDDKILSTDSVAAQGDGIVMAEKIGADTIDMEYIQTYPVCDPETGALLYVGDVRLENHGILVNREGDRFVQELDRRDVISNGIKNQPDGVAFLLFDQAAADETGLLKQHADEYENSEARGVIVKADTLDDVAKAQGVDAAELKKTVEKWNQYCADGKDPDFGYSAEMNVIGDGPYYLMACKPAVHYTMGGLHITPEAEVLTVDGTPIAGLYAAGEVAGHKMGTNRLGSCSMTDIYTFGRIAGNEIAARAKAQKN